MTQITKEQLEEALTDVGLDTIDLDVIRSYITQLEANQRQPVRDEKLMEAVSRIDDEFGCATEFNRELCENDWAIITNALSELEERRAASKWQPTKGKLLNVIGTYLAFPDDGNIIEGLAEEIISQDWSQVNDQQLPTQPAQEVK